MTMQIGLIGGIGPAATDFYYQNLIRKFAKIDDDLDLTIVHADAPTLLGNLATNNVDAQVAIYHRLAERLVAAGAECVVVTSIGGHFCIGPFKEVSPLPVIDMLMEVSSFIETKKLSRIGILGTRTVMETRFYGGIQSAEVVPPAGAALDDVHDAYVAMASAGVVTPEQRAVFDAACHDFIEKEKVDAVMMGGTDLALVYDEESALFPIIDCAAVHVDAIARYATA